MFVAEVATLRSVHHRAVVVDHFTQSARGVQSGHAGEVHRGLGVACTSEYSPFDSSQGNDVAGP